MQEDSIHIHAREEQKRQRPPMHCVMVPPTMNTKPCSDIADRGGYTSAMTSYTVPDQHNESRDANECPDDGGSGEGGRIQREWDRAEWQR
jgi:hypothetical protein